MKSNSKILIKALKVLLDVAWFGNFLLAGTGLCFLLYLGFISESSRYLDKSSMVYIQGPDTFKKELVPETTAVRNALLSADKARLSYQIKNSMLEKTSAVLIFLAFEFLVFAIIYHLRKLFTSLNKGISFSPGNVVSLKRSAGFILLIFPLQLVIYLLQSYSINTNFPGHYRLTVAANFHLETLVIAAILYIVAEIFNSGFDLKRENEEFV